MRVRVINNTIVMKAAVSVVLACLAHTSGQGFEMETNFDVAVNPRPQLIYSSISPKIRVYGKGFGKDP